MTPSREEWRAIPEFEGQYEVSDHGRVRGLDRVRVRRDGVRIPVRGCIIRSHERAKGYLQVSLQRDGVATAHTVHQLVLKAFVGPPPKGMEACHNDGDKSNNRLSNLRWDTQSANTRDLVRHGTHNQARKTHCPRGHRLEAPNLKASHLAAGRRGCLACHRAHSVAYQAAKRGKTVDFATMADIYYERLMQAV